MFCPKCGEKISDDVNFCPYCGNNIKAFKEQGKCADKKEEFKDIFEQNNQKKYDIKKEHLDISDIFEIDSSKNSAKEKDHTIVFKNNNVRRNKQKNMEDQYGIEEDFEKTSIEKDTPEDEVFVTEAYERELQKKKVIDDIEFTSDRQFTVNIDKPMEDSDTRLNSIKEKSAYGFKIAQKYFLKGTDILSNLIKGQATLIEGKKPIEMILLFINALIIVVPIFIYTKSFNIGLDNKQMIFLYISMLILFIVELFTALCTNYATYKALNYFTEVSLTTQRIKAYTLIIAILISLFRAAIFLPSKILIGMSSNVLTADFFGNHAIIYILVLLLNMYFVFCSVYENQKVDRLKRIAISSISIVTITVAIYLIAATIVRTILMQFSGVLF